jgi:ATP-dependent exoDNAse (exonuclease V) beta subunit
VPILALNELGQTISGNIDMLVETEQGYWIIDHKTDQKFDFKKHYAQLQNYAQALKLDKPVLGVALNWVRAGKLEILKHKE